MINKILVPLDGSASSEIALPLAEAIAEISSAGIILATATGQGSPDVEPLYRSYLEKIREKVRAHLKNHAGGAPPKLDIEVLKGAPADEILRYADLVNPDLIIMASRGSTAHGPWLLGSIATRVTVASTRPVLVVKSPVDAAPSHRGLFQKILVPLDGSEAGESALPFTGELAKIMGSELILFHGVQPAATWIGTGMGGTYPAIEAPEDAKRVASSYMEGVSKLLRAKGLNVRVVLQDGPAAELIVDYAKAEAIDVIAVSTHGRTGISRWVFGSVTEKILRYGGPAVLVVRAKKT